MTKQFCNDMERLMRGEITEGYLIKKIEKLVDDLIDLIDKKEEVSVNADMAECLCNMGIFTSLHNKFNNGDAFELECKLFALVSSLEERGE